MLKWAVYALFCYCYTHTTKHNYQKGPLVLLYILTITEYHHSTLQCIWASSCQCSLFQLCLSVYALNKWLFEWTLCRGHQQHCLVCTLGSHPRACASMLTVCLFFDPHWLVSQTNDHKSTFLVSFPHFCVCVLLLFTCLFCPFVKSSHYFSPQAKDDDGLGGKLPQHSFTQDTPRLVFNTNSDVLVRTITI